MKRTAHVFEAAFTRDRLLAGFHDAARTKHGRHACLEFSRRIGTEIEQLHRELHSGSYRPRAPFTFTVREPKPRTIHAPAFRDCVVQHAAYQVIAPLFDRGFIDQSFACRVGRGTHRAADYAQRALRAVGPDSYTLKLDVRRFFYRINRGTLRGLIERRLKDGRMVDVLMRFADHREPTGIPIGSLLSQLYALVYLSPVDHFIKRTLGVRWYCRYVDDLLLVGLTHDQALAYRARVAAFLRDRLGLELSRSTIARVARGVNFVGYRTWPSRRLVRRRAQYVYRAALRRGNREAAISCLGHARHTHSLRHLLRYAQDYHYAHYCQLPAVYHA